MGDAKAEKRGIFFGWWTVLASGIIGLWGFGSSSYSFGTLFKPLVDEFGWSRAEITAASSLRQIEGGVGGISSGWFTDKYGPRAMCLLGTFIAGLGYILMYYVNSLWSFYLVYGIIVALGFTISLSGNLDKAIADWFVKRRGLATGIFRVIVALQIVPPFVTWLIASYGWRQAFILMGLITWGIGIPLGWFCIKPKRPEYYGLLPDGAKIDGIKNKDKDSMIRLGQEYVAKEYGEVEYTISEAVRTRSFWTAVIINAIGSLAWPVITTHLIPFLTFSGMDEVSAAATLSFTVTMGFPGRLIGGALVDKLSVRRLKYVILLARCLTSLGFFLLAMTPDLSLIYISTLFFGLGNGLDIGAMGPIRTRFFGRKAYSTIMGAILLLTLPVSVSGPLYVAWVYDIGGGYRGSFTTMFIIYTVGILACFFFDPPKQKPKIVSDVEKIV